MPRGPLRASLLQRSEYFHGTFLPLISQLSAAKEVVIDRHTTGLRIILPCYGQHHYLQNSFLVVRLHLSAFVHIVMSVHPYGRLGTDAVPSVYSVNCQRTECTSRCHSDSADHPAHACPVLVYSKVSGTIGEIFSQKSSTPGIK